MAAEVNVILSLPRHCPGAAQDLAKVFDRFELLPFGVGAVIEDEKNFTGVIVRAPEKIILMAGDRGWQSEFGPKKVDRAGFAVILAENRGLFPIVGRQMRVDVRDRASQFFPAELISEKLWQRSGVRSLGAWRFEMDRFHVRGQFFRREKG